MRIRTGEIKFMAVAALNLFILTLVLLFTEPSKVPLALLLLPFICLGLSIYSICSILLTRLIRAERLSPTQRIMPAIVSLIIVIILLLQSVSQFTWKDAAILAMLVAVICFYLWRADFLKK